MGSSNDPSIHISGGAGSTEAAYDDLLISAHLIDTGGDAARSLTADLARTIADLPEIAALMSPGSAAEIAGRSIALTVGPHGFGALALELEILARGVRLSVQLYIAKDAAVASAMTAIRFTIAVPHAGDVLLTAGGVAAQQTPGDFVVARMRDPATTKINPSAAFAKHFSADLGTMVRQDPSVINDTVRTARFISWKLFPAHGIQFEQQVAGILGIGSAHGYLLDSKKLTVTAAGTATSKDPRNKGTIGTLVHDEAAAERAGNIHRSRLSAHRRIDAQGNGHWVVDVPGTEDWGMNMPQNPSDATANVRSLAGEPSSLYPAVNTALAAAMKKQGIRPGSEPVMLVGHSQGGIVAARLAANPQFRTRYNVTHLITIASPESRIKIPKSVQALSIEHNTDPVPRLDARKEPPVSNRTRAVIDPTSQMKPGDTGLTSEHESKLYAKTADTHLGRDKNDPLLRQWYAGTEGFMNGTDVRYDYNLSRP